MKRYISIGERWEEDLESKENGRERGETETYETNNRGLHKLGMDKKMVSLLSLSSFINNEDS